MVTGMFSTSPYMNNENLYRYAQARVDEIDRLYGWRFFVFELCQHLYVHYATCVPHYDMYTIADANYLLKCVQRFNSHGILPYAISIQVSFRSFTLRYRLTEGLSIE